MSTSGLGSLMNPTETDSGSEVFTIKKEAVYDDDDSEFEDEDESGTFLCEVCDTGCSKKVALFKDRRHLVMHTVKRHPTTCMGCYETFESAEDLRQHAAALGHSATVCHQCWDVFPDKGAMNGHKCTASKSEGSAMEVKIKEETLSDDEGSMLSEGSAMDSEVKEGEALSSDDESIDDLSSDSEANEEEDGDTASLSCLHCSVEGLRGQSELRNHTGAQHPTVCCICFEGFDEEEALHRHQEALYHWTWKCVRCKITFIKKTIYKFHVRRLHPEDCPFKCSKCENFASVSAQSLRSHVHTIHNDLPDRPVQRGSWILAGNLCSLCDYSTSSRHLVAIHMYKEHQDPGLTHVYKCKLCTFGFGDRVSFGHHLEKHHADNVEYLTDVKDSFKAAYMKSMMCKECRKMFTRRHHLYSHMQKQHPSVMRYKCNICENCYTEEDEVRVHKYMDHGAVYAIKCPYCEKIFRKPSGRLLPHFRKAHKYKGMPYAYCFSHGRGFKCLTSCHSHFLRYHDQSTTGYPCNVCGEEFGNYVKLSIHQTQTHMPRPPKLPKKKCPECGVMVQNFSIHMALHTDKFQCDICGKCFGNGLNLTRHRVVHTGQKPFQCELCGLRVSQKSSLQRHQKVVHPGGKVKKTGRRPSERRTRGPLMKKTKTEPAPGAAVSPGNETDKALVDVSPDRAKKEEKKKKGTEARRRRPRKRRKPSESETETSVSEDDWELESADEREEEPRKKRRRRRTSGRVTRSRR